MPNLEEFQEYISDIEQELAAVNREKRKLENSQLSLFGGELNAENLIKWQLDLREDLERIYHLLKGDQLREDEKGQPIYVEPANHDLRPFNEFGVQLIMNVMSFYLNRNTILSNYAEETINYKVYDFSIEISDLIFNRYEEMMMTTTFEQEFQEIYGYVPKRLKNGRMAYKDKSGSWRQITDDMVKAVNLRLDEHLMGKIKMYTMIVRELVDSVHSAYLRALNGGERSSLREARTVNQTEGLGRMQQFPMVSQPKQRRISNLYGLI